MKINHKQIGQVEEFICKLKSTPACCENEHVRFFVESYQDNLRFVALNGTADNLLETMKDFNQRLDEVISFAAGGGVEGLEADVKFSEILKTCETQYVSQLEVAWKSGLFNDDPIGGKSKGIMHWSHVPCIVRGTSTDTIPTWNIVKESLQKNKEIIQEKHAQGFTKMLVVPFGYDLKTMAERFKVKVRELDETVGIFGAGGEKVEFKKEDEDYPVYIWDGWDENQLVYYPKQYTKEDHGGLTKDDAIKINGAWQICFVEDMPVIPLEGKDVGGRRQIDRRGSCIKGQAQTPMIKDFKEAMDNLELEPGKRQLKEPTGYSHEKGQTPEQYLWMQLTSLLAKEKPVLMDYENNEYRGTYLIECFSVSSRDVPFANWYRSNRQFFLDRSNTDVLFGDFGVRTSVNIIK